MQKLFNYKVIDCFNGYNFAIKFVFIRVRMKNYELFFDIKVLDHLDLTHEIQNWLRLGTEMTQQNKFGDLNILFASLWTVMTQPNKFMEWDVQPNKFEDLTVVLRVHGLE
jgi:hypothetical protein